MTDDHELERVLRAGLERRVQDVDIDVPVVERARAGARRRRQGRVAAGVAALVVAAVAVTGAVVDGSNQPHEEGGSLVTDGGSEDPTPAHWRTEYWHAVQVDVPADWGWGAAPNVLSRGGDDLPTLCGGPGAAVTADGRRLGNADPSLPYVGRPIMLSDLCTGGSPLLHPEAPYVWLGADLEAGTVELAGGYVQETRVVDGSTVTVGTSDAALRERILDSVRPVQGCEANLPGNPRSGGSPGAEHVAEVASARLCAYESDGRSGFDLVYAASVAPVDAQAFLEATYDAPAAPDRCVGGVADEYVGITVVGRDEAGEPAREADVVVLSADGCARVETMDGAAHDLTGANVRSWTRNGIPVVLHDPSNGNAATSGRFIGMLG